ncbi:E3 SUMO-protein ligase PIAS2 isoform X3 [Eupeodes corollae]|nr:E3 SUMO-protein ligase PIAS2 isoform X3 [Eupeodes corollae]
MIQTFRVVDLHKVLQFLSLSVAGRKHELQQRVLDLLKTNFELVSTKLREIYRTDYYSDRNVQYGPPDPKRMFSHMQMPTVQSTADVRSAMVSVGNVGNAGVGQNPGNGAGAVPANMGVPFQHNIGASMPIHPDVRLKKLAFYDVLATLIKPSSLLPRSNQRIQELPFYFTLTPQQATEIATNRDIRNGSKVEHSIQVQLRFCLLETSCEQEDCFPSNVIVKVNNKLCPLPNPIPTNRPNVEPKRPPRPVNVTSNVKLSPTVTNTITVQWCPDFSRGYCIAAYLVKKLTSSQLLHRMKTKGIKPADYTRGLIKEKLTEDADCEIATTMLKVSLNCPLGKMKMSIPCRASTCSHLQCFDANLYLQMNERKPTWNCPVCDKPAIYDHLVIDGYFQEVLASSLLGSEDTEIQLHKDGSWSTHNLRNETQLIDTPSKPVEKVELISDDIELITDDVKPLTKVPPPPVISNEPTSTTNSETVDLTLSDSDDDMPLAKRKTSAAKNATTSSAVSTSNGQRSATVQSSQSSKGALEGSINHEKKSLKPQVCDISNKIRQYRKKCHTPSSFASVIQQKEITSTSTSTKVNQSNINSTNQVEQSIGEKTMSLNYNQNNDAKDGNKTVGGDLNGGNSVACSNNETIEPISEILLPKKLKKKKSKSRKRSRSVQSTRDQSVVSFKRFLETFGSGCDINSISKSQRLKLRKMWARENQLQETNNNNNNPFTRNNNFSTTVTSDYVQGPSTSTSSRSPEMAIPALMSLTVDPPFSQMERSVFTLDNLHMNSGLDRDWLDATHGKNNYSRRQLSSLNRIHRILCDTQKKSKSDSKIAKSLRDTRSLPKGLKLNELLEYATVNFDTISKLSTERKLMYQRKQPYARQLLQRCKQWRVLPPHLEEAFQRGLI